MAQGYLYPVVTEAPIACSYLDSWKGEPWIPGSGEKLHELLWSSGRVLLAASLALPGTCGAVLVLLLLPCSGACLGAALGIRIPNA